ncbi:MAG: TonB-dependent receptor [Lutibacter sp.]|nr:TonB-dependent receptor [Lutibacter sp.]
MKKFLCLTAFILVAVTNAIGQQSVDVSGLITDAKNQPLPGVSIVIEGTMKGASSDFNGKYEITNVSAGTYTLTASFVGYKTISHQITVSNVNVTQNFILQEDLLSLDEVIVTGSSNPKTKLESSIAVTTMSAKEIESKSPQSTADLLQSIPGFLVETSGGEVGNNLFARGIPSAGAYEYVQIQEDGLPIFEDGALQFANIDNFYRVDLTVNRMEAVKGGSASIFASGAPGGIINFSSKTGQNETKGITKLTVGDYGLFRTDFNIGGAVVEDKFFFNVGGFYRVDQGVRSPGFDANKGGQVKMNFTYKFDKGYARIYFKHLNDRNIFYQSTPFVKDGDDVKEYPGFDANYGTFTSRNFSKLRVPQSGGSYFEADLEDGVHPVSNTIGGEFKFELTDNITVNNAFKNSDIDMDYNAIFASQWMGDVSTQNEIAGGFGIPSGDAAFTYDDSGNALSSETELKRADYWFIHKKMRNFVNNLSFNFKLENVNLTVGHYYSNWKSDQNWNWSSLLVSASDNPRLVNLSDSNTGVDYSYNGITAISWLQRESQIKNTVNAFFADAEFDLSEKFTANIGLRYDDQQFAGVGDHGTWGNDIGILDNNTADNGVNILKGDYTYWDYDLSELSYTGALNYKMNSQMASYVRYSHGFRAPIEESFYGPAVESGAGSEGLVGLEPTLVNQTELGFKYSAPNFALFANAFYMKLDNIAYQDIGAGGTSEKKFANVENLGLELEAIVKLGDLNLNFNGTLQNPEYTGYEGSESSLNGNTARRIAKFYFIFRPDYNITENLNVYVNASYFGKKYQDIGNTFELPAFNVVNVGGSYTLNNIRFGLDASNLFNTIGLTEADGRADGAAPVDGQTFMGRSILGRAVKLSVAVNF